MADYLSREGVLLDQDLGSREEALRLVARTAVRTGAASDVDAVLQALLAREDMGATGMLDGFAVPHAKTSAMARPLIVVCKGREPVSWPSFDEKPVDICIALLAPDPAEPEHIAILARVAVMLMDPEFRASVRAATDAQKVVDILQRGIDEG